ncbi:hypothetical protein B0H13DRAFT_233914 [Mycena leptocephala]|nr:hypothetical protein B0H13DRAFT_233914 [Mycena leptocephala]
MVERPCALPSPSELHCRSSLSASSDILHQSMKSRRSFTCTFFGLLPCSLFSFSPERFPFRLDCLNSMAFLIGLFRLSSNLLPASPHHEESTGLGPSFYPILLASIHLQRALSLIPPLGSRFLSHFAVCILIVFRKTLDPLSGCDSGILRVPSPQRENTPLMASSEQCSI